MVRTAPQSTDPPDRTTGLRREGGQALVMVVLFLSSSWGWRRWSSTSATRSTPSGACRRRSTPPHSPGPRSGGANQCQSYTGSAESPAITAYSALLQIASGPDKFYDKPDPGQLRTIFTQVAADIRQGSSALIDESIN